VSTKDYLPASTPDLTALEGRRIVVMGTAAPGAAFLPSWLGWMAQVAPDVELRVVLTRSARGFVGPTALRTFTGVPPIIDDWEAADGAALHVDLAQWAEGWLIHPATMNLVARLAAGLCDSPAVLALQSTLAPIVVAASAPPGFVDTPVWQRYTRELAERPNVHLLEPLTGVSAFDPSIAGSPPAMFPHAASVLAEAVIRHDAKTEVGVP